MYALTAQARQGGIKMEELFSTDIQQLPEGELIQIVSDGISRDSRRYPVRFNTENE